MILCVTPNIALDRTIVVPGYGSGGVFRPQEIIAAAGGKGINVARVIRLLGGRALCFGFIAGHTGAMVASDASDEGLDYHWTILEKGETRICTILVDPTLEQTTVINEPGARTSVENWVQLRRDLLDYANDASAICFCGSLPPGSSLEVFTELLVDLRELGKDVWVDMSGPPLQAAAGVIGIHIKVNEHEAALLLNSSIADVSDAAVNVKRLADQMKATSVITLAKQGAVLSDGEVTWHAQPPMIEAKSAVASGDSFLAGLLVGLESSQNTAYALQHGAAAGTANALSIGGGQFKFKDFQEILSKTSIIEQNQG